MPVLTIVVNGVPIPRLVYGTAWKEDRTATLVREALRAGFRGIDTANQRKHYHEAGVGEALKAALSERSVAREDLFLQTKFTFVRGQDDRLPYEAHAPVGEQVAQSFASSLEHLGVDHLDSLVLHGPWSYPGLAKEDWEAWGAMEALARARRVSAIGISNVAADQLAELHASASVKPSVVQNRTLTRPAADLDARRFCREHALAYQGFSLLTAAPGLVAHPTVRAFAGRARLAPAAAALRLFAALDIVVLTGTASAAHMAEDVAAFEATPTADEVAAFSRLVPAQA